MNSRDKRYAWCALVLNGYSCFFENPGELIQDMHGNSTDCVHRAKMYSGVCGAVLHSLACEFFYYSAVVTKDRVFLALSFS